MTRAAVPLLALCALLAACGGGNDRDQVRETVRDFVTATDERDADAFCGELVTREFIEQTTGATGDDAQDACRKEFGAVRGLDLKLHRIRKTTVDGDTAEVTAVLETRGERRTQLLRLQKEDGDWKLAGGDGG